MGKVAYHHSSTTLSMQIYQKALLDQLHDVRNGKRHLRTDGKELDSIVLTFLSEVNCSK